MQLQNQPREWVAIDPDRSQMRLLFLSNLYPPVGNGGYEEWCREVAEGLRGRGHEVVVLTSQAHRERVHQPEPEWVRRELFMEMEFASLVHGLRFFTSRQGREATNLASLERQIERFQPDMVVVWGMWNLTRALPALAEKLLPGRVVYYLGDYWPTLPSQHEYYWQAPAQSWVTRWPKGLLRPVAQRILQRQERPALQFQRVIFPSQFMQEELQRRGMEFQNGTVIYGAIDTQPYQAIQPERREPKDGELALLYAGRLAPEKGIHTAIQAMDILVQQQEMNGVRLTIAGSGERSFESQLRERVRAAGLEAYVTFCGPVAKEEMPQLYHQQDVFLFTSTWQEPFGRVLVEALAAGLVIIGTATGGASEILVEAENALTFPPNDAQALAHQIQRLVEQPELRKNMREKGRQGALQKFDLERMVGEIEAYLKAMVS